MAIHQRKSISNFGFERISWKLNSITIKLLNLLEWKNHPSKSVLKHLVAIVLVHSIGYLCECFVRLFRENVDDDDRTWINIVKDKDELESAIKLLITDNVVRKNFPEWKFAHEPFNALEASNEFQERYMSASIAVKEEEEPRPESEVKPSKQSVSLAAPVKIEKKVPSTPKKAPSPPPIKAEVQSDEESSNSIEKSSQRSHAVSFEDTNSNVPAREINNNQEDQQLKSSAKKSRRRKFKG